MDEYIKREDALDAVLFALVGTGYQSRAIRAVRDVPTADVAPKSEVERLYYNLQAVLEERAETKQEVAREILSDLKKAVHDKAVYSYTKEMFPYINLKVFDAIIQNYLMKYAEERKE